MSPVLQIPLQQGKDEQAAHIHNASRCGADCCDATWFRSEWLCGTVVFLEHTEREWKPPYQGLSERNSLPSIDRPPFHRPRVAARIHYPMPALE